jgi:hypothetical protein
MFQNDFTVNLKRVEKHRSKHSYSHFIFWKKNWVQDIFSLSVSDYLFCRLGTKCNTIKKAKLFLGLIKHHAVKMYEEVEV